MNNPPASILGRLRLLAPRRDAITYEEALRTAELQASRLVELLDVRASDLGEQHIAGLPRFIVTHEDLIVSGMSHWNGAAWVIALSEHDSPARQRFTLLHEFKHIIDHPNWRQLYVGDRDRTPAQQAEAVADYFAGCALIPKRDLKSAWGRGLQRPAELADYFSVSAQAIAVRLSQTKLNALRDFAPTARCARPVRTAAAFKQQFRVAPPAHVRRSF